MAFSYIVQNIDPNYGVFHCPPDWYVQESGASFHRLYYAYNNHAVYRDDSVEIPLKKGHLYLFPVNHAYTVEHTPDKPFCCLYFHLLINPEIKSRAIFCDVHRDPLISQLFQTLEISAQNRGGFCNENGYIENLLQNLLFLMNIETPFESSHNSQLQKVTAYIHEHYAESLTNLQLAQIAGYDVSYLTRLFKRLYDTTPQKYLTHTRMRAAEVLLSHNLPVSFVGDQTGYPDSKSFCRAFKIHTGLSPTEYKKCHFTQP